MDGTVKIFKRLKRKQFRIATDARYDSIAEKLTSLQHNAMLIVGQADTWEDMPNIPFSYFDQVLEDISKKLK